MALIMSVSFLLAWRSCVNVGSSVNAKFSSHLKDLSFIPILSYLGLELSLVY